VLDEAPPLLDEAPAWEAEAPAVDAPAVEVPLPASLLVPPQPAATAKTTTALTVSSSMHFIEITLRLANDPRLKITDDTRKSALASPGNRRLAVGAAASAVGAGNEGLFSRFAAHGGEPERAAEGFDARVASRDH
jgi:hypothetical protein